jgi:hypothetical protein
VRRRDVALCIAAGLFLLFLGFFVPIGAVFTEAAVRLWYLGVAAAVASLALRWRRVLAPARLLGVIGVTWVTMVVGYYALLVFLLLAMGPIGP